MKKPVFIVCAIIPVFLLACVNNVITTPESVPDTLVAKATKATKGVKTAVMSRYSPIEKNRFVLSGDEVFDRKTEKTWKRCDYNQTWDEQNKWCKGILRPVSIDQASSEIKNIKGDWRIPDVGELMSLFDVYCAAEESEAREYFGEIKKSEWYATSTPNGESHMIAVECFGPRSTSAGVGNKMKTIIRLVRDGNQDDSMRQEAVNRINHWKSEQKKLEKQQKSAKEEFSEVSAPQKLYNDGQIDFKEKRFADARLNFERITNKFSEHPIASNAYFWIGQSLYAENKFEDAILAYEIFMKKYPQHDKVREALLMQGRAFVEIGDKRTGKMLFERLIEKHPQSHEALEAEKAIAAIVTSGFGSDR